MNGRLENKIKSEQKINRMLETTPEYVKRYCYSIGLKTHKTKETYLEQVLRFLNKLGNGKEVTLDMLNKVDSFTIQKYISDISYYEKNNQICELSNATKATNLSSISSFFRFLAVNGYIDKNPFDGGAIERPKPQEKEVVYLDVDEVKRVEKTILDGAGSSRSVARQQDWKYRDFCLFWLPVTNGIRVGALSEINMSDIDFNDMSVSVVEKGNKPVRIYFNDKAAMYLHLWIEQRKRYLGDDANKTDALFISNRKTRMTVLSIERAICKYTEAGINRHISPHKLRATFATNLYRKTRDIELTSKALHHKSTVPTQKYVDVINQDIKNAVNLGLYN